MRGAEEEGGVEEDEAEDEQTEERRLEEGGQMDTDDCRICPGTEAPPPLSLTSVAEVSAVHTCLNRDAAQ